MSIAVLCAYAHFLRCVYQPAERWGSLFVCLFVEKLISELFLRRNSAIQLRLFNASKQASTALYSCVHTLHPSFARAWTKCQFDGFVLKTFVRSGGI